MRLSALLLALLIPAISIAAPLPALKLCKKADGSLTVKQKCAKTEITLTFDLLKGNVGDQGPQGAAGNDGAQGPTGAVGATGPSGTVDPSACLWVSEISNALFSSLAFASPRCGDGFFMLNWGYEIEGGGFETFLRYANQTASFAGYANGIDISTYQSGDFQAYVLTAWLYCCPLP